MVKGERAPSAKILMICPPPVCHAQRLEFQKEFLQMQLRFWGRTISQWKFHMKHQMRFWKNWFGLKVQLVSYDSGRNKDSPALNIFVERSASRTKPVEDWNERMWPGEIGSRSWQKCRKSGSSPMLLDHGSWRSCSWAPGEPSSVCAWNYDFEWKKLTSRSFNLQITFEVTVALIIGQD